MHVTYRNLDVVALPSGRVLVSCCLKASPAPELLKQQNEHNTLSSYLLYALEHREEPRRKLLLEVLFN